MDNADTQHDVIVIGAGIAGLVAANRAAQLGKRVVVLEKGEDQKYLCNSRYTYGTFHINYTDVGADEDVIAGRIDACSDGTARKDLARAVARDGRRLMQWLRDEGLELVDLGGYQTNVLAPPWRKGAGLNWRGYSGDVALERLEQNLRRRQGRLLRGMRARALALAAGAIVVETDAAAGAQRFGAPFVVIADGGFPAGLDLIRAHICAAPEKLLARNGGSATGDGLRMVEALGAASTGLDKFYGHLHSRDAMRSTRLWPRPYVDEIAAASIVIDAGGSRFADEGLGGIFLSNAIARQPDPLGATIVFDQAVWDGAPGRGHAQPPNPLLPEAGGTLHRADTIAELAKLIGIAPQRLEDLVRAYNAAIDADTLHLLSPPRRRDRYKAWPIRTAPFYAIPICAAITTTMGGIVVDHNGAVLDRNDTPLPGLFAAGSTIGGLDGGPNAGYVGGLIKATIALRAAEAIAAS
ncbi:MAG TPA: FAD-dependent oxidoreductase [Xanthobacteraceae bacterium]|nr:FAD-dependent oxidoreductase [Xanthobacteraceae bacterium]